MTLKKCRSYFFVRYPTAVLSFPEAAQTTFTSVLPRIRGSAGRKAALVVLCVFVFNITFLL
ncbi:hypothetical protein DN748_07465 [Sinomicrobium soli]|nr:hypothetical protein DN748_07465 [Sinomicrobium sp. N-1-3-6]